MTTEDSQPQGNVKTIRDFVKSGAIVVVVLIIGMLIEALLSIPTFAYVLYLDGGLALVLRIFVVIILYVTFMSFIGYMSYISNHKFGKQALSVLHKLLIMVLCLFIMFILLLPAPQ